MEKPFPVRAEKGFSLPKTATKDGSKKRGSRAFMSAAAVAGLGSSARQWRMPVRQAGENQDKRDRTEPEPHKADRPGA